jgi:proteasome assembly chaperone (PAC2) family protein
MDEKPDLKNPWLIAVWPGMGQVALSAGYYLMAKLGMHLFGEFSASEWFDVESVDVKNGLIQSKRLPRSRFFASKSGELKQDVIVFIGEAQPSHGKYAFCRHLIEFAQGLGVQRVFTFAALATSMRPEHDSRTFVAAIDSASLAELERLDVSVLKDGHIGGLNGTLLGAAAEAGLRGGCILGEMPRLFSHLPFPKASLSVLDVFSQLSQIEIDTSELSEQARAVDAKLGEILSQMEGMVEQEEIAEQQEIPESEFQEEVTPPAPPEKKVERKDRALVSRLFEEARKDRTKAYELKQELDRLGIFQEYEDRFLDLFKNPE